MGRYLELAEQVLTHRWARRAAALLATVEDADLRVDLRLRFEERAGICAFDGGLPQHEAERAAYRELAETMAAIGTV
jgi:hypothetical protein